MDALGQSLPLAASGSLKVRHYMIDRTHSNSYQTWVSQGKPATPTQAQWVALRDIGELCSYSATQTATGGTWTVRYPQNVYGVSRLPGPRDHSNGSIHLP